MSAGSYLPPPVGAAVIPKPGGGTRTLGCRSPTASRRLCANRIGTVTEKFFHADSYSCRPGRGAHEALAVARRRCRDYDWVVEFDIRRFFDSVPHDLVVRAVEGLRLPAWVLLYVKSQARARQVLAALEQRMKEVGLELHPDKTRIIYCKDYRRPKPWDAPVSFDFLGYAFRPRDTIGKNSRFTGFDLAVSPTAVKRMNEAVSGWRLHRHTGLTWEQLTDWIGPVIQGWMTYLGRFRHSVLGPLAGQDQPPRPAMDQGQLPAAPASRAMKCAWDRITDQMPGLLPHWRWETGAWF